MLLGGVGNGEKESYFVALFLCSALEFCLEKASLCPNVRTFVVAKGAQYPVLISSALVRTKL